MWGGETGAAATIELPQAGPAALLGSVGDISIIVQAHAAIGVNTRTGAVAWQVSLNGPIAVNGGTDEGGAGGVRGLQGRVIRQINGGGRIIIRGGGRLVVNGNVINGDYGEFGAEGAGDIADPETSRRFAFSRLGGAGFSTMRIVSNKLVIVANGALSAYDVATGKPAWQDPAGGAGGAGALWVKLPAGTGTVVEGNDDLIVSEIDSPDRNATTFFIVDSETGKFRKQISLDDERVLWRSLGDDGKLYAVTDQSVVAYDLFAGQDKPLWRRSDIQSQFPGATVLSLDGLILVNANSELMCLSQDGGEVRWPTAASGPIRLNIPEAPFLRATLDGDVVIYQSAQGILAYYTYAQENNEDQVAWIGSITQGQTPPLDSFQIADPYVVLLASGPANGGAQRSVRLILLNRKGGRIHFIKNIQHNSNPDDPEGPAITAWQVVDDGIAMEVGGAVHFYHGKRP